jgi:hypothetical protein
MSESRRTDLSVQLLSAGWCCSRKERKGTHPPATTALIIVIMKIPFSGACRLEGVNFGSKFCFRRQICFPRKQIVENTRQINDTSRPRPSLPRLFAKRAAAVSALALRSIFQIYFLQTTRKIEYWNNCV